MKKRKKKTRWLKRQLAMRPRPLWLLIVTDALLLGVSLVVFALFHHVLPRYEQSVGIVSSRVASSEAILNPTQTPFAPVEEDVGAEITATEAPDAVAQTPEAEQTPTPEPSDGPKRSVPSAQSVGWFGDRFPDKFTDGEVVKTDSSYRSSHVNITLQRYSRTDLVFYVADIYIKDIICFKTVFAQDTFSKGLREAVASMNERAGGVIAINGDYYGSRSDGFVMRNGELYRNDTHPRRDVCVLFWDGSMETYAPAEFDVEAAVAEGACHIWNFGPMLLDENGGVMTKFNSDVWKPNPRTALGYFEPGHYCFVVVDGRSSKSKGLALKDLSELMHELGCVRAYNLDGGNTSVMVVGGRAVNNQSGKGRITSDAIVIVDN